LLLRLGQHAEWLVGGVVPDDLQSALTQRLRWAMGALQVRLSNLSYIAFSFLSACWVAGGWGGT
jgi:cellulose synthase/poly-beta-1,6-N-acetylglucosamine synthase-like glycosyltransferase